MFAAKVTGTDIMIDIKGSVVSCVCVRVVGLRLLSSWAPCFFGPRILDDPAETVRMGRGRGGRGGTRGNMYGKSRQLSPDWLSIDRQVINPRK